MQQPLSLKFRPRRGLRDLIGARRRTMTPAFSLVRGGPEVEVPAPVLVFPHEDRVPSGDFASEGIPNGRLTAAQVPGRGAWWELIEEFALTYDGYAYWSDVAELGNRAMQRWTRDQVLSSSLHELRGCLFYEQRRWHHFGDEPSGRGAEYVWALLDAIRTKVTFVSPTLAVVGAAPPSLPTPPLPPPPAAEEVEAVTHLVRFFTDDDAGYLAWLADHRAGFVVNAPLGASTRGLKLHRATCSSVSGSSTRSRTTSCRKVCSFDADALRESCVVELGIAPEPCQRCRP